MESATTRFASRQRGRKRRSAVITVTYDVQNFESQTCSCIVEQHETNKNFVGSDQMLQARTVGIELSAISLPNGEVTRRRNISV